MSRGSFKFGCVLWMLGLMAGWNFRVLGCVIWPPPFPLTSIPNPSSTALCGPPRCGLHGRNPRLWDFPKQCAQQSWSNTSLKCCAVSLLRKHSMIGKAVSSSPGFVLRTCALSMALGSMWIDCRCSAHASVECACRYFAISHATCSLKGRGRALGLSSAGNLEFFCHVLSQRVATRSLRAPCQKLTKLRRPESLCTLWLVDRASRPVLCNRLRRLSQSPRSASSCCWRLPLLPGMAYEQRSDEFSYNAIDIRGGGADVMKMRGVDKKWPVD